MPTRSSKKADAAGSRSRSGSAICCAQCARGCPRVRRRWLRILAGLLLVAIAAAAISPIRRAALGGIGRHLTAGDAPADAGPLPMDMESGFARAIKLGDPYPQHAPPPVALALPGQTPV